MEPPSTLTDFQRAIESHGTYQPQSDHLHLFLYPNQIADLDLVCALKWAYPWAIFRSIKAFP